ncbi:MAG: hypothetical protein ACR2IL_11690 [Chitinophagaceae bacterium]
MNAQKNHEKPLVSKGDRLNWSIINSVQTVKLTRETVVGKVVCNEDLKKRSNSNSQKSIVLIH